MEQTGAGVLGRFVFRAKNERLGTGDSRFDLTNAAVGKATPGEAGASNSVNIPNPNVSFPIAATAIRPTAMSDDATNRPEIDPAINVATDIDVLANDTAQGTPTISMVSMPAFGTAVVNGAGTAITYTPPATINSDDLTDTFTYAITDVTTLESVPATVTIQLDDQGPVLTLPDPIIFVQNKFVDPNNVSDGVDDDLGNAQNGIEDNSVSVDGRPLAQFTATAVDAHGPAIIGTTGPALPLTSIDLNGTAVTFTATDLATNPNTTTAGTPVAVTVLLANGDLDMDDTKNFVEDRAGVDPTSGCNVLADGTDAVIEDVDASGAVDLTDVLTIVGAFGSPIARLDIDGDGGNVDLDDVLAVVGAFGTSTACV